MDLKSVNTDDPFVIKEVIEKGIEKITIAVATEIHQNLTADPRDGGTPVKSGFASASWICSIGDPSIDLGGSPGRPDKSSSDLGLLNIKNFKLENGFIYIVNNTPHIEKLGAGSSPQASAGFIDSAVIRGVTDLKEI